MKKIIQFSLLFISVHSLISTPAALDEKKQLTSLERRQIKEHERLESIYQEIIGDYASILSAFHALKHAAASEYAFYLSNLKTEIITAIEENKLGQYKSVLKRALTNGLLALGEPMNPLQKFRETILPRTLISISYQSRYFKQSLLRTKIDLLAADLRAIKKILI